MLEIRKMQIACGEAFKEGRAPEHDGEYINVYGIYKNSEIEWWGIENAGGLDVTEGDTTREWEQALIDTEYENNGGWEKMLKDLQATTPLTEEEINNNSSESVCEVFQDWA